MARGPKLPDIIADYVRDKVKRDVEDLLDDPHGFLGGMDAEDITAYFQKFEQVAKAVQIDLPDLIKTTGTDVEVQRLKTIIYI